MSALPFIQALTEANYTPTLNAVGVNDQGQYVDESGAPTSLFKQPGWWQRAFNPEARQIGMLNAQGGAADLQAQQQALIQRRAAMSIDPTLDPTTYANTYDPRFSPVNRNTQATAQTFSGLGGPQMLGTSDYNAATAGALQNANAAKAAAISGLLGNPQLSESVQNSGLNLQAGENAGNQALQPQRFSNMGLGMSNENTALLGQQAALPYQNQAGLNTARSNAGISGQALSDLPYTTTGMHANSIADLYQAEHPNITASPFAGSVNPFNSTIHPGRYIPEALKTAAALGALPSGLMGQGSQASTIMGTTPSGLQYRVNTPAKTDDGIDPLQDLHDKYTAHVDATHKAAVSDKDAKIAQLKSERTALMAHHTGTGLLQLLGQLPGNVYHGVVDDPRFQLLNQAIGTSPANQASMIGSLKNSLWDNGNQ